MTPVQDLATRVRASYVRRHPAASDPMFDFDERGLLALAQCTGFGERHLELRIDSARRRPLRWDTFVRRVPNPLAPTLEEAMAEALTRAEADRFVAHLRPLVERGEGTSTVAVAYLWAVKG